MVRYGFDNRRNGVTHSPMLPLQLLFFPAAIFRSHPVRKWREVTLWLKWGLLFSIVPPLLRVSLMDSPETFSGTFSLLNYLAEENDALTLDFPVKFGLFFLALIFLVLMVWLIRSGLIYLCYRMMNVNFNEGRVAMSVAGASMVNGVWLILPLGWYLAFLHGILLIAYLTVRVNRIGAGRGLIIGFLAGIVPFVL